MHGCVQNRQVQTISITSADPLSHPRLDPGPYHTSRAAAIAVSTHIKERGSTSRCSQESHNDITEFTMRSFLTFQVWKYRQPFSGRMVLYLNCTEKAGVESRDLPWTLGPTPWAPLQFLALSCTLMSFKGHCLHDLGCHRIDDFQALAAVPLHDGLHVGCL